MLSHERYNVIMDHLRAEGNISIKKLTSILNVSTDTVRRDLKVLEDEGKIKKVHGGAVLSNEIVTNHAFENRKISNITKKQEISKNAIKHIKEFQAVALNAGTTNIEFAKEIIKAFDNLTVITNSLLIANILSVKKDFTIIVTGGFLDHEEHSFYGKKVIENIYSFNADTAFINVNAISLKKGITDFRQGELEVINAYIENVEKVIVLADSSKFETISYLKMCDLNKVDIFLTDSNIDGSMIKKYKNRGIEIHSS